MRQDVLLTDRFIHMDRVKACRKIIFLVSPKACVFLLAYGYQRVSVFYNDVKSFLGT